MSDGDATTDRDRPVDRAFADHGAFEPADGGYRSTATPFEARATATADGDGDDGGDEDAHGGDGDGAADGWRFTVVVRVPTLSAAVEGTVGPAVADGWFETFAVRVEDAYDVRRSTGPTTPPRVSVVRAGDGEWSTDDDGDGEPGAGGDDGPDADGDDGPGAGGDRVRVEFGFVAGDPRRGVDDAAALVDFVEGTYVQGVVPGYEYRDPVAGLLARARRTGSGPGGDSGEAGGRGPPPG